jgi:nicotinamide phosphoribosyltransferase
MVQRNRLLAADSYKTTHAVQYPPGTTSVYSYFTARGGDFPETTFFGLQGIIKEYLLNPVTAEEVNYGADRICKHMGPKIGEAVRARWMLMVTRYDGKFPIKIKAVPEGTTVGIKNILMAVESNDDDFFWVVGYLESLLSRTWYPTTVCTHSREMKKLILASLKKTGTPELIDFKLHDFGARGVSSGESAAIGGTAHLVNFKGTDTMECLDYAKDYYNCDMAGFSIPASEHSPTTAWGTQGESEFVGHMLATFDDTPVAMVIDSYDDENFCKNILGGKYKSAILARDPGHFVVARPDSGEPNLKILQVSGWLSEGFGRTINDKGYKVLPPQIRGIYGDGIDYAEMKRIIYSLESEGWSMDNWAFGEGGGLLQKCNRDTHEHAYKTTHVVVNGEGRDVFKSPKGMPSKNSRKGRMKLVLDRSWGDKKIVPVLTTVPESDPRPDELRTVFENGELLVDDTLDAIRERAKL